MIDREQIAAMFMATLLAVFLAALVLLQMGCMASRGVEEMSVSVPAVFQFEMEFNDEQPTSMNVGPSAWWQALLHEPELPVVPVEQ
tara:strand:- start:1614 stop:1871 length:258 start_codon:yes stop_codon:yes gene_type:complete